jgi:DNA-binding response OmpR family regulator
MGIRFPKGHSPLSLFRFNGGVMPAGAKILVVEDNFLLAEVVCEFVVECDMEPIGPAAGLETGLVYARETPIDGAILDINLDGRFCFPICDVLRERAIPFAFLTGCSNLAVVPQLYRPVPLIAKPFEPREMRGILEGMLGGQPGPLARAASSLARQTRTS